MGKMIIKNRRRQDWNPNPLGMEATTSATVPQILSSPPNEFSLTNISQSGSQLKR